MSDTFDHGHVFSVSVHPYEICGPDELFSKQVILFTSIFMNFLVTKGKSPLSSSSCTRLSV